jgi:DNA-binding SARP family transcriptional activator/predicted ATPase
MAVKVKLLGPPRVERDGRPVAFDTRKATALLAYLALAGRPLARDTLAELLWPDHDAEHARGALRRTLSTLRSAIGPEALEATRDRLTLVRGPGMWVDVDRFRALAAEGEHAEAVALFAGEFLEGFGLRDAPAFDDWQRGQADELARELAGALGRVVEEREAAGDPAGALGHARRWLGLDPLNEPAHRALIRLYAWTGDRAAALGQYRECVRTLSRELGVPPLEETTRLYEAVSEGTLETPAPAPPFAPAERRPAPLIGRDADRRALVELWSAIGSTGRVALVEGEAGVGKTRLADELLAHAREHGAAVLAARAYEEEGSLAYGPIVEALRARTREDAGWAAAVPTPALGEAARLLPELAGPPPPLDGPVAQRRFLDAVWTAIAAAAAGPAPGVLFVDDAQWADEPTLGLLAYGLRRLAARPMLVLLAWRTPYEDPLRQVVEEAQRDGHGAIRRLERLTAGDTEALVRAARPDADADLPRRLHEATEGLPFLLVEYLSAPDAGADGSLPAGARAVLRSRLASVSETARQVLAAAAVIGRSFDVDTVRAASGRGDEETVAALEELVARGLIREGAFDYDFGHEQLRALAYEETSLARRRLLHGRAADAGRAPAATLARHLRLAGRDAEAAAAYVRAAEQARRVLATAEALEHLRAALALGHRRPGPLYAAIGDLETLRGDYAAAIAAYETAAAESDPAELAAIEHRLGQVHQRRGDRALAVARLEAALEATDDADPATRSRISADLGLTLHESGEAARAGALARTARDLAEQAGDPQALGQAFNLLGILATSAGAAGDALAHLERSLALAEQTGESAARVAALNNLALVHRSRGELGAALELTRSALGLCVAQGDRHREAALHNNVADLLHAAGRPEEAMQELKLAVAIFAEVGADEPPQPEVWKLARW